MEYKTYIVLDDSCFGDASNATVYIQDCDDDYNVFIMDATDEMDNSGECRLFCKGIGSGEIPGQVVHVLDLLKLRELVAELKPEDVIGNAKLTAFFEAVNNLDLF